jgi:hypothetical protein
VAGVFAVDSGGPPGARAIVASNHGDCAAGETNRDGEVLENDPEHAQNAGSGGVRGRGDRSAALISGAGWRRRGWWRRGRPPAAGAFANGCGDRKGSEGRESEEDLGELHIEEGLYLN